MSFRASEFHGLINVGVTETWGPDNEKHAVVLIQTQTAECDDSTSMESWASESSYECTVEQARGLIALLTEAIEMIEARR